MSAMEWSGVNPNRTKIDTLGPVEKRAARAALAAGTPEDAVMDGPPVAHRLVGFAACGVVTGPGLLAGMVEAGVGPGKAHGAGLLLVGAA